ncbi:MAG: methyltransferase [Bacteroidales bacterium]
MEPFLFKQFSVHHERSSMHVNTDSVVLGAWANSNVQKPSRILDIGTGCGILALMMAQRFPGAVIDAVDIDDESAGEAAENALHSPWSGRINVSRADFRFFMPPAPYDLIITNPPYFSRSLLPKNKRRIVARHSNPDSLSLKMLAEGVSRMLAPQGVFAVILPEEGATAFLEEARSVEKPMFPHRITRVFTRSGKPALRMLVQTGNTEKLPVREDLTIYENNGNSYSAQYVQLVKGFYLWA